MDRACGRSGRIEDGWSGRTRGSRGDGERVKAGSNLQQGVAEIRECLIGGAGVIHNIVGLLAFPIQRPLAGLAVTKLIGVPAATPLNAIQSLFERGIHKNDSMTEFLPSGFQQQGCIQKHCPEGWPGSGSGDLFAEQLFQARMDDGFEVGAGALVLRVGAKYEATQLWTVDCPLRIKHGVAKATANRRFDRLFGENLVPGRVSADDCKRGIICVGERAGKERLAGTHATDQTNNGDRMLMTVEYRHGIGTFECHTPGVQRMDS